MKSSLKSLFILALTAVMLFTISNFTTDTWTPQIIDTTASETTTEPTTVYEPAGLNEDFNKLLKTYKDLVGYIKIPGTVIDDVVVQSNDNAYYLRRSPKGYYQFSGSYFSDYRCDMTNLRQNTTIYGHNLRDTSRLFGQLTKYKKLDFYKQSPIVYFDTITQNHEWKIFAIFITNTLTEDGVIFSYRHPDYDTQDDFLYFIDRCKRRSIIDCPVDVQANDKVLTLSTCDYQIDNDWRLVVMARMLRVGETPTVDVSLAQYNDDVLYPEGWYKRKGGTRPYYQDEPLLSNN